MSRNSWIAFAILAVITSVFGIWTALNQSGATAEHITGQWTLIEASDAAGDIDVSPTAVVVTIDDTTINGMVCNGFGGDYRLSGLTLTVGPLAQTEMYCTSPDGIMDLESRFITALGRANTVRYEGTNLVLNGVDIRLVFAQSTPD
ncbi:MAG: META domain-containing protein [Microbacteriaceae bacterium]